tara:strand:- start:736 stop:3588 length:2853 start_codon:yes stop_codon:yes gene_type:complete
MLTSEEQMQIIKDAITSGYNGPIFKLIDEGHMQKAQIAATENQQEQGLRGSDGNTAMAFPESSGDFNTQGMDFDVDIRKYDNQGNLVKSYNKVPPGVKNLQMGEGEGTVIETPSQYQDGGFYPNPNQPVNIQVDNEKKRREQEKRNDIELKAKIDKEQTEIYSNMLDPINVADAVGMTGIPVISEAGDLVSAGISTARGNYTDASLSMAGIAVPFAGGAALKQGKKTYNVMDRNFKGYMKQIDNREDLVKEYNKRNNVYRTDNITGPVIKNKELTDAARHYGFDPKDPKQMAEFLGTTPTRGSGNRAGWSGSWGGSDIKYYGNYPGQTLNRYGLAPSRHAFTTKINLFDDDIAKLSDNQLYDRISALDAQSMHNPNLNIFKTARDVGKLDNLPHGSIINTNTIQPPGIDVTSQIVGRTNIPIRQSKGVLSADEVRQLTNYGKNPFATFQEGGVRRKNLNTAIDEVVKLEDTSNKKKVKKLLEVTNFMENSMGYNPEAYNRTYTNSQASIDEIMLNDLFDKKKDKEGNPTKHSATQKKYFTMLKNAGLPTNKSKFQEELTSDNSKAAVNAMRMVYGKSPEPIPEVTDTLGMFNYYNDNYRKNTKIKDLTESKKRFYEGYKSTFQKGGFNFNKKKDYSQEAIKERKENSTINYEDAELAASFLPYAGEVIDAKNTVKSLKDGKYGEAALHAAGFMIPFVPGGALVRGAKKLFGKADEIVPMKTTKVGEHTISKEGFDDMMKYQIPPAKYNTELLESPQNVHRAVRNPIDPATGEIDRIYQHGPVANPTAGLTPITTKELAEKTALELNPNVYTHKSKFNVGMSTSPNKAEIENFYAYRLKDAPGYYGGKAGINPFMKGKTKWDLSYNLNPNQKILNAKDYNRFMSNQSNMLKGTKTQANILERLGYTGVKKFPDSDELQFLNPKKSLFLKGVNQIDNLKKGGMRRKCKYGCW